MLNLASYWPVWLAVILSLTAGIYQGITEFQKMANLFGAAGRWLYNRSRERFRMDTQEFNQAVRDAVANERTRWEDEEARALTVVEKRLEYFIDITKQQQAELSELAWNDRCHTAYAEYESDWHHQLRMQVLKANRNGGHIPIEALPESMHFGEFRKLCQDKSSFNWRTWGI